MSRGREVNTLYLANPEDDNEQCTHLTHPGRSDALDAWTVSLGRSSTQTAAINRGIGSSVAADIGKLNLKLRSLLSIPCIPVICQHWSRRLKTMEMTQEHKDALAQGRKEARAIKAYLKTIDTREQGRPVSRESLVKRLDRTNGRIEDSDDPLKTLDLIQTRLDIQAVLSNVEEAEDLAQLEADFVQYAKPYSERKAVSYTAWREFGVPAAVLRKAGVPETRRR
jgi:hypothetical protein